MIGEYKVHYDDKSVETIPIVYGKDVRDWFDWDQSKPVTHGKVAWTGENARAKELNLKLRLYVTTWQNPHPDKRVVHIDYSSTNTACAPFCLAITAERK